MTTTELKRALIGVIISKMEDFNNTTMTIMDSDKLHKSIETDIVSMYDAWWVNDYPDFDYAHKVETISMPEPKVTVRWTPNRSTATPWYELQFLFNPVRLIADNHTDPIAAYDRAMAII